MKNKYIKKMDDNIECQKCHNIFPKQNQIMHDARCTIENPMPLDESRKIQLNQLNNLKEENKNVHNNSEVNKEQNPEIIPNIESSQINKESQPSLKKYSDSGEFPDIFVCEKCGETLPESEKKDHMYCHNLEKEEREKINNQNNDFQVTEREIERQKEIEEMIKRQNDMRRRSQNQNSNQQSHNQRGNINPNNLFGSDNDMQFFGNMGIPGIPNIIARNNNQNNLSGNARIRFSRTGPNGETIIQEFRGNSGGMENMMNPMMNDPLSIFFAQSSGNGGQRGRSIIPFSHMNDINSLNSIFGQLLRLEHPTDQQILNELPETQIEDVTKLDAEKKNCVICLEDFKNGEKATVLPCIHMFHTSCIQNWLKSQNTCPICKFSLTGDNIFRQS